MGPWLDSVTSWLTTNPQWLGLAVFIVACVECLAIAGIIVPGTVLLFAIAVLAGSGALSLGQTLLLGFLGGLLGDMLSYALGRRFHQNIRRLPLLRTHPEWMTGAENYFQRYGIISLIVGRFIGPLRPMLPMVAGMCDMPLPRFILVSLLAGAGWSVAYLLPGWATGAAIRLPLPENFWPQAAIVAVSIAALLGLSIHANVRRQPKATLLIGTLSLALLVAVFFGYSHMAAFDQGISALVQEHRSSTMDMLAVLVTQIGNFRTQLLAAALVCALLFFNKQWRALIFFGGVTLFTAIANTATKHFFARMRPDVLLDPLTSYSMPSGHSSGSFAFFLALAILAGREKPQRMRITCVLIGCLLAMTVAMSRIYLGAHWPTDIMAGAFLAITVNAFALALTQRYMVLSPVPVKVWWMILPSCAALYGFFMLSHLSKELLRYAY
ncbi:bifunctional DedA family/phosphatase PAP2 family protein [Pseudomonas helleri]|uniref:bifunctional DedA family/phosphatase PAP2 family protein n=1 Tax=Pseudomonas helleri TaxID=1608996 RepID=UPI00242C60CB|nr:bifunctional DedA family/phosphatase PAP2 family protein [Pseudomonas helleri]